jgi:RNA polymerase sigma factor (sigma-70 family)
MTVSEEFTSLTGRFRGELLAHCYRMLGSAEEAEDLVQETYLRAWRSYEGFEGRSSVRTWLYRIATNVCLTAIERRGRRPLPSGLGGPTEEPEAPLVAAPEVPWLQPVPDALLAAEQEDPAAVAVSRAGIRLALVAALQYLSARQRAVLILRDVLEWPAAQVAELLGTTTTAVNSGLRRAVACAAELHLLTEPGRLRLVAVMANGQPAFAVYQRERDGTYGAHAVLVPTVTATGIARIVSFLSPGLFASFGLPPEYGAAAAGSTPGQDQAVPPWPG